MLNFRTRWPHPISASVSLCGVLAASSVPGVAYAAVSSSATLSVSASVQASCDFSVGSLDFGLYTGSQKDATTTISVVCTNTTPFSVGLYAGSTAGATIANRMMTGAGDTTYKYALYMDSEHIQPWGTTVGTDTYGGTGSGNSQTLTVYGRLPAAQFVRPGAYYDSITATITY